MSQFQYAKINFDLVGRIAGLLESGTVAIVGPPYGGKTLLMRYLHQRIGPKPGLLLEFKSESPITDEDQLRRFLADEAKSFLNGSGESLCDGPSDLLQILVSRFRDSGAATPVLVSSIDGLDYGLARQLLSTLGGLVDDRMVQLIVTGEFDSRDLLFGPDSIIGSNEVIVLQGFDRETFLRLVFDRYHKRAVQLGLQFESGIDELLWELTGGSDSLVAAVFWVLLEGSLNLREAPVSQATVRRIVDDIASRGPRACVSLMWTDQILSREPSCWTLIPQLIRDGRVRISTEEPPGALELSGAAVRQEGSLVAASPVMREFLRRHYGSRRLGDLFCRSNAWPEAFRSYAVAMPPSPRPADPVDRPEVTAAISSFCMYLHSQSQDLPKLFSLLAAGFRYLLGFVEVTFWERRDSSPWAPDLLNSFIPRADAVEALRLALERQELPDVGIVFLDGVLRNTTVACIFRGEREDRTRAVLVGDDPGNRLAISGERRSLAERVFGSFEEAYSQGIEIQKERAQREILEDYNRVLGTVLSSFWEEAPDLQRILPKVAAELRDRRYSRLMFSLVTRGGDRIKGAFQACADASVRVDEMTDWILASPNADIQPWVIANNTSVRVRDALKEPLVNQLVVRAAKLKAFSVIPIRSRPPWLEAEQSVIGTLHVERLDGSVPTRAEVTGLENLMSNVGLAAQIAARISDVETALCAFPDPLVIMDSRHEVVFANRAASLLMKGKQIGWIPPGRLRQVTTDGVEWLQELQAAVNGARRPVSVDKASDWLEGVCVPVGSDPTRPSGAMLHLRDSACQRAMFRALETLIGATTYDGVNRAMLTAGELVGCAWGRLYEVSGPLELALTDSYDLRPSGRKLVKEEISLPSRDFRGNETWETLRRKKAILFVFDPDGLNGAERVLSNGLKFISIAQPNCAEVFQKTPGDMWIDLPLVDAGGKEYGKITFDWKPEGTRVRFEFFELLARSYQSFIMRAR